MDQRNENAWRREALGEEEVLQSQNAFIPESLNICSVLRGKEAFALVLARADQAHKYTDKPIFLKSAVVKSRRYGSFDISSFPCAGTMPTVLQ